MATQNRKNSLEFQLGQRVKWFRERAGMTQGDLGILLASRLKESRDEDRGIWHQPDISDLENGRRWPRTDVLMALASIFRVNVHELISIPSEDPVKRHLR